jgi:hypothetical protein
MRGSIGYSSSFHRSGRSSVDRNPTEF